MVFDSRIVKSLLDFMEQRSGRLWHDLIVNGVDHSSGISFSEYELYGNYALSQPAWRQKFLLEYWHGKDCTADDLARFPELRSRAPACLNSISLHRYTQ